MGGNDRRREDLGDSPLSPEDRTKAIIQRIKDTAAGELIYLREGPGSYARSEGILTTWESIMYALWDQGILEMRNLSYHRSREIEDLNCKDPDERGQILRIVFNDFLAARDRALSEMGLEVTDEVMEKIRINHSTEEFRVTLIDTANAVFDEFFAKNPDLTLAAFNDSVRNGLVEELDKKFTEILKQKPNLVDTTNPRRPSLILAQRFLEAIIFNFFSSRKASKM